MAKSLGSRYYVYLYPPNFRSICVDMELFWVTSVNLAILSKNSLEV